MPDERLTDAEIAERIRLCVSCKCGHCKTTVRYARELQSLRASDRELRGMVAGLADAADSAWNLLSTTEPTSSDTLDDWKRKDKFTQGAFEILDSALTPAVRAVAEVVEKEKNTNDTIC